MADPIRRSCIDCAVTTTLVVKDRVLMHNPASALYTADSYHEYLNHPIDY